MDWVQGELELLKRRWPTLEFAADGNWVLFRDYQLPQGWSKTTVDLVVRIPGGLPGEVPYGFWVSGGVTLSDGSQPGSYSPAGEAIPFFPNEQWGKFSWAFEDNQWQPGSEPGRGTGMVHFVDSIGVRFKECS